VRRIKRVTDQYGVGALGIEGAVGFDRKLVTGQDLAAAKPQRLVEGNELGGNHTHGTRGNRHGGSRAGTCGCVGFGRCMQRDHMDLFSWIYQAPASGSGKSAPQTSFYSSTKPGAFCPGQIYPFE